MPVSVPPPPPRPAAENGWGRGAEKAAGGGGLNVGSGGGANDDGGGGGDPKPDGGGGAKPDDGKAGAGVPPENAEPAAGRSKVLPAPEGPRMAFRSLPVISERGAGACVKRSTAAFTSRARPPILPP